MPEEFQRGPKEIPQQPWRNVGHIPTGFRRFPREKLETCQRASGEFPENSQITSRELPENFQRNTC
eukprot:390283-Lingulodinium_polyedra.AAC.1